MEEDWDWSHNGLGGAKPWNFEYNGINPKKSPSNPKLVANRARKMNEAQMTRAQNRKLSSIGWQIIVDPSTGYEYYWNEYTGESQWDTPILEGNSIFPAHKVEAALQLSSRPSTTPEVNSIGISATSRPSSPEHPPPRQRKRLMSARKMDYTPGEWRQLQESEVKALEEEAKVKRRAAELETKRNNFLHERKFYCVEMVQKSMKVTFKRLRERGCLIITFQEKGPLGIQFIPRKTNGCMVAKVLPDSRANVYGIRRGNVLISINQEDVTQVSNAKSLIRKIQRHGFPLTMMFRPAPNRTDTALRIQLSILKIQKAFRKRVAWRKKYGAVLLETIARGYLGRRIARFRRQARTHALAARVLQKYVRGRLSRDYVRLLKAKELGLSSACSGWFIMQDFAALRGGKYYVHSMKLDTIEYKLPQIIEFPIWEKLYDAETQTFYYYNTRTMASQWSCPSDYVERVADYQQKQGEMPEGLKMLRAASVVQRAYRAKMARDMIKSTRILRQLEQELESMSDPNGTGFIERHAKWEELGLLYYKRCEYEKAAQLLALATDDFHIRQHQIKFQRKVEQMEEERKQAKSNLGAGGGKRRRKAFQLKNATRTSTRVETPLGVNVGQCMHMLAVSLHHQFTVDSSPITLRHATHALEGAFLYRENNANPDLLFISAKTYASHGSFESALRILSRLITTMTHWPKLDAVVFFAASLLKGIGRYQSARTYFEWVQNAPFIKKGRTRSYLLNFQLAHLYQLENQPEVAMSAFQACYKEHPTLGAHIQGNIHSMPKPEIVQAWLSQRKTWEDMIEPLGNNLGCPILAAECMSETFQRMPAEEQQTPETWFKVAVAAMQAGNRKAATAWALGALEKAPFSNNFSEHVRELVVGWEHEKWYEHNKDRTLNPEDLEEMGIQDWHIRGAKRLQRWIRNIFQMEMYRDESPAVRWLRSLNQKARVIQRFWHWHVWVEEWWKPMQIRTRWKNSTQHEIAMILRCQVAYRKSHGGLAAHMRKQAKKYKEEEERQMNAAALRVQGAWRRKQGTYASFILQRARNEIEKDNREREMAAIRLQCAWRKKKGTFAQHMLKSAQRDAEKDAELERIRLEAERRQFENSMAKVIQRFWNNRMFSQITNLVAAAIERKRLEDAATKIESLVRGMIVRKWMRRRHEIATTTAAAFRGYVGRVGSRLKKKLKRQRAVRKIKEFIREAMRIKEVEFIKRDTSAIQMQKFIRGFLVRWRSHAHFATAVKLWGLEVLHDRLGRPVGKETERAMEDGKLLANAIWCRYPCPNPGVMFHAARAVEFGTGGLGKGNEQTNIDEKNSNNNIDNKTNTTVVTINQNNQNSNGRVSQEQRVKKRKIAWSERTYMDTFTKATDFMPSTRRPTPQSIGTSLANYYKAPELQPTFTASQSVPAFTLSRAMKAFPLTSDNVVRYRIPRSRPTKPPPDVKLAWGPAAAHSLKLDVKSLLISRKQEWVQRHVQNKWRKKQQIRRDKEERKMKRMVDEIKMMST